MSIRKWANFLPAGKDFTIPARNFLPVGKGLHGSPAKVTKRHDGRGRRILPRLWPLYVKVPGAAAASITKHALATGRSYFPEPRFRGVCIIAGGKGDGLHRKASHPETAVRRW